MQLPIPDDLPIETFHCVQIKWPNSPKWNAILAGLILAPSRGRFWDKRTGSIVDTQAIGYEIDFLNFPLVACESDVPPVIDTEFLSTLSMCGDSDCEECDMGCSIPYGSLRWSDGKLQYINCGIWYDVDGDYVASLPAESEMPDPPTVDYTDSTACAMVTKLATRVYEIVVESFLQVSGIDLVNIWDYYNDMNDAFANMDLAFGDLMNMWASTIALDAAGLEGETKDTTAAGFLACAWVDLVADSNTGITAGEYEDLRDVADTALKSVFPSGSWSGFGDEMRSLWKWALASIGDKDVQKLTYYTQATAGDNCDCPGVSDMPLEPVAGGWYLGGLRTATFNFDDVKENSYTHICFVPEHDVYGLFSWADVNSISGTLARWAKGPTFGGCSHDIMLTDHSSTHSMAESEMDVQMEDTPATTLYDAMVTEKTKELSALGLMSKIVGTPVALGGQSLQVMFFAVASAAGSGNITIEYRLVHNTGSPSHL